MKIFVHNLFYTPPEKIFSEEIIIDGEELHHLKHVLRKNINDVIFVTDGKGYRYKVKISYTKRTRVKGLILEKEHIKWGDTTTVALAFVPLKGLRNDFVIEKGTELGVRMFLPFISRFSVLRTLGQPKLNRFKKIAISAMLQSQQYYSPDIIFQKDINTLVKIFDDFDLVLLADRNGESRIPSGARSVIYIVGPEGGFDKSEINLFTHHGARLLSLGSRRLRSETAAICGITKVLTIYKKI